MRSPSPECYTTFWMMTIYSNTLHRSGITPILTLLLIWTLLANLTFYLIARGIHKTFATGAACQQMALLLRSPGPVPLWTSVLMLRQISPELVLFPDFWVRTSFGTSVLYLTSSTLSNWSVKTDDKCSWSHNENLFFYLWRSSQNNLYTKILIHINTCTCMLSR